MIKTINARGKGARMARHIMKHDGYVLLTYTQGKITMIKRG